CTGRGRAGRIFRIGMNEAAGRPPRELHGAGVFMAMEETATSGDKIRCDACPVMCYIKPGAAGACDRYANHDGRLVRVDPHIVLERTVEHGGREGTFQAGGEWGGQIVKQPCEFVHAVSTGTT